MPRNTGVLLRFIGIWWCETVVTVQCDLPPAELDCDLSTYASIVCGRWLFVALQKAQNGMKLAVADYVWKVRLSEDRVTILYEHNKLTYTKSASNVAY